MNRASGCFVMLIDSEAQNDWICADKSSPGEQTRSAFSDHRGHPLHFCTSELFDQQWSPTPSVVTLRDHMSAQEVSHHGGLGATQDRALMGPPD